MKTYARRRSVEGDNPKLCPKCDRWFDAVPRVRMCGNCRPNRAKTASANLRVGPVTPEGQVKCKKPQVTGTFRRPLVDGISPSEFHPNARVAACYMHLRDQYPHTYLNFVNLVDWRRVANG